MDFDFLEEEEQKHNVSEFTLTEYPNTMFLNKIHRHKDIYELQQPEYRYYCDLVKDGKIEVQYVKTKQYGRYFIKNPKMRSGCVMWRKVRATLFAETDYDIDIVACHQALLYNCVKDEGTFKFLKMYVKDKDLIFKSCSIKQKCIDDFNSRKNKKDCLTKKDFLKNLVTRFLYGGIEKNWADDFGLDIEDYKLSKEFNELKKDMDNACSILLNPQNEKYGDMVVNIRKQIIETEEEKFNEAEVERCEKDKRLKPRKFDIANFKVRPRKVVSILLQELECRAVMKAFKFLKEKNIIPTIYCYDGFQVKKDNFNVRYIDEINHLMKTNNYGVKFEIKEFVEPFSNEELNAIPEPPNYFSQKEFVTLISYQQKKLYFETHHKKIISMDGFVYFDHEGNIKRIKNLRTAYGWIYVDFIDKYANEDMTIPTWYDWSIYPNDELCPPQVYNTWTGFEVEKKEYDCIEPNGDISNILYHFMVVANFDEKLYEYLLNYYAHIIQRPEVKTNVCLLIQGRQGTGKTTIAELLMKNLLGKKYVFDTPDIEKICGRFNGIVQGKILGVLNEATGKDTFGIIDKIKDSITREDVVMEFKGIDPVVIKDYCNYIYTTNNINPVKIDEDDRRFQIIECSDKHKNDKAYFTKLREDMNDKKILKTFYKFLKERNIENFDIVNDRVVTEATLDIHEINKEPIIDFIEYLFNGEYEFNTRENRLRDLYNDYKSYMTGRGYNNYSNDKYFGKLMKKHNNGKYEIVRRSFGSVMILNYDVPIHTQIDFEE
tara:strand:+ start:61 stop:2373 length:2313 start_codon:yes stop_codon:yes gene_type:complete